MSLGALVAKNLRKIRKERGYTQDDLADLAGITKNYVGQIEREEKAPTITVLERLAKSLKVKPISFFEE